MLLLIRFCWRLIPFCSRLGEMAVVRRHVFLFTVLHAGLALLQVGRLLRVQLPALDAVANALLLAFLRGGSLDSPADGRDPTTPGPAPEVWLRFEQRRIRQ